MNLEKIYNTLYDSIRLILGNENIQIHPDSKLIEELGLESIDFIDLIFETEKNLSIQIDIDLFSKEIMKKNVGRYLQVTVKDLAEFICQKK